MRNEVKSASGARKIIVLEFITLDGVVQAPGGPQEDTSGGFAYGGWQFPYFDDEGGKLMAKQMQPTDLLLGRKTYDIFAGYWPTHTKFWPSINKVTKYVVSKTLKNPTWENTVVLSSVEDSKKLKKTPGSDLHVYGSSNLVQALLTHGLVDELWLKIHPLTLGKGKKLFQDGTIPVAFTLIEHHITSKGVIFANYRVAGEVKTGSF